MRFSRQVHSASRFGRKPNAREQATFAFPFAPSLANAVILSIGNTPALLRSCARRYRYQSAASRTRRPNDGQTNQISYLLR